MNTHLTYLLCIVLLLQLHAATASPPIMDVLNSQGLMNDVAAVFEFDGTMQPTYLAQDFTLNLDAANSTAVYDTGKSGQGVLVEESTTNLLSTSTSGVDEVVTDFPKVGGSTNVQVQSYFPYVGAKHIRLCYSALHVGGFYVKITSTTLGSTYTGSVYLRKRATDSTVVRLYLMDATNSVVGSSTYVALTDVWTRYRTPPITLKAAASTDLRLYVESATAGSGDFYADAQQIEAKPYATPWVAGGTTRSAYQVRYTPSGTGWQLTSGTNIMWVKPAWDLWTNLLSGWPGRAFLATKSGEPNLYWGNYNSLTIASISGTPRVSGGNMFAGGWQFLANTWSPTGTLAMHNTATKTSSTTLRYQSATEFRLGPTGRCVIDQWVIFKRALTSTELTALYNATL